MTIETTTDAETWKTWRDAAGVEDVYYSFDYLNIWESEEKGEPVGIRFDGSAGRVLYPLVRVPLDSLDGGEGYVDVRTAYDFGGPLTFTYGTDGSTLLDQFEPEFTELLESWNTVTEFARLHPLRVETVPDNAVHHADNYVVDLSEGFEPVYDGYKSSFARNVRQAEDHGLDIAIDDDPGDEERTAFSDLYLDTMEKVDAEPFYFFDRGTLEMLMDLEEMATVTTRTSDGDIIASALVLESANDLFYFLGASDQDYLELRPNNILFDRIIRHAARSDYDHFHLGGGSQGLRRFKSQMATGTVDYHLFKRIHDHEAYEAICEAEGEDPEDDAFPPYRDHVLERA